MAVKNLSKFITPDLKLQVGDKTYTVPPPSKETGKILLAINIVGIAAMTDAQTQLQGGETVTPVREDTKLLAESVGDRELGELSLGAAWEQIQDDWDGPTADSLALYAFYYWTLGEAAADEILASREHDDDSPKDQKPSKSGSSTE